MSNDITPYRPPSPPVVQVLPKNPGLALLISFFLPGVGSMYAGNAPTGCMILTGYIISWIAVFFVVGIPFALGFWIWGLANAFSSAQRWNRARGIES